MSNPSLILPQSPAYGEDYVYAAQVEDGAVPLYNVLPLTFTRASGGTRINKDGLVQNMPYNLVTYSQDFSNGAWINASSGTITRTSGFTDPMGGNTAFKLVGNNSLSWIANNIGPIEANNYTLSIWLKTDTTASVDLLMSYGTTNTSTKSITSTWVRYEFTASRSATAGLYGGINVGNGVNIYAWGAQLNIGSTAQPYLATTDRLNMPRITYPVGGGCGALLLEKQSTNFNTYSQSINATNYVVSNTTTSENILLSPDGTINATKLIENTNNSSHGIIKFAPLGGTVDNSAYCTSVFVKAEGRSRVYFYDNNQAQGGLTYFNLATGSVVSGGGKIENYGNGWYRLTIFCLKDNSTTANIQLYLQDDAGNLTYTGNGTSGIGIYGMQCEASSYATSYIPTTSTSATRIADACSKTGISNLIGQTSGTILWDLQVDQLLSSENILNIDNGSFGNTIYFLKSTSGGITTEVYASASLQCSFSYSLPSVGRYKIALAYANNDFALYVNGVSRGTDTSGSVPATSRLQMGNGALGSSDGKVNELVLYTTRLTNAELQALTS